MERKRKIDCWVDEASGLPCLILLGRMGESLGYVGIPPSHPYYGVPRDLSDLKAYGGVSCSEEIIRSDPDESLAQLGDLFSIYDGDRLYVFGFHCATGMDYVPGFSNLGLSDKLMEEYGIVIPPVLESVARQDGRKVRDDEFVRNECRYLAAQLARITGDN